MLAQVKDDLEKYFYDGTYKGVDLERRFVEAETRIRAAGTHAEIFGAIAQALFELNDSHTFFLPPAMTTRVDYGWDMEFFGDSCFVSEVSEKSDARAKGLVPGDLVLSVNGNKPTRDNLWKLAYLYHVLRPQPGLRVVVQTPGATPRQLDLMAAVRERPRIMDLTGADGGSDIWTLVRDEQDEAARDPARTIALGNDLLIWRLPSFNGDMVADGARELKNKKAAILDLRRNPGGSQASLVELVRRFHRDDVALGSLWKRSGKEPLTAKGRGDDAFAGDLIVLVDSRSASAAEVFARTVQLSGRGRVVGDRTAGAVMRGRAVTHSLGREVVFIFGTSVTDGDLILRDGTRLEGRGVLPDIPLVPSSADLAGKRDPVLARAAQLLGVQLSPEQAWALLHKKS